MTWGCVAVGALITWLARNATGPGMTNERAAFYLGLLLLGVGLAGVVTHGTQTTVVDPAAKSITVEDQTYFGRKVRTIRFAEIAGIDIGYLGRRSSHVTFYFLELKLRDGTTYPLFAPGRFYEGSSTRSVVEGWRQRLETLGVRS
jgi:hypothetical protein